MEANGPRHDRAPVVLALLGILLLPACRGFEPVGVAADMPARAVAAVDRPDWALARAEALQRRARKAERAGRSECVDLYYEGAVFAYAALFDGLGVAWDDRERALTLYNESLA